MRHTRIAFLLCTLTIGIAPLMAQQQSPAESPRDVDSTIKQLQEAISSRDQLIADLERRVEVLEQAAKNSASTAASASNQSVRMTSAVVSPSSPTPVLDEEERSARAALDRTLISRGGLLLPPWTVEVENGFSYYNSSSNNININGFSILPVLVVGNIVSQRVRQDVALADLTSRFGLPREFQFEVRVPYGIEVERSFSSDGTETSSRGVGIGDIEAAMYKQVYHQKNGWPDILTGLRVKTTTGRDPFAVGSSVPTLGTGFPAIQGSVTAVKASDPAVFFGNLSYTANLARHKPVANTDPENPASTIVGNVNPGDTIGGSIGTALALNPSSSLSVAYEQSFTRSTSFNGVRLPGTYLEEAVLRLGTSYMYAPGRALDLSVGIGLTRDTPDLQFTVAVPLRFSLKRTKSPVPAAQAESVSDSASGS